MVLHAFQGAESALAVSLNPHSKRIRNSIELKSRIAIWSHWAERRQKRHFHPVLFENGENWTAGRFFADPYQGEEPIARLLRSHSLGFRHSVAAEPVEATAGPLYRLMCSNSFRWSYQVNLRISEVAAITPNVIAAVANLQVTM